VRSLKASERQIALIFPAAGCLPQQKILEYEFSLASGKRSAANTAVYLIISGFCPSLSFDHLTKRIAIRTFEMN
jgi:hypothetical protein